MDSWVVLGTVVSRRLLALSHKMDAQMQENGGGQRVSNGAWNGSASPSRGTAGGGSSSSHSPSSGWASVGSPKVSLLLPFSNATAEGSGGADITAAKEEDKKRGRRGGR